MSTGEPNPNPGNSSPFLFYVMLGVILLSLVGFFVLRFQSASPGLNRNPNSNSSQLPVKPK